jgi:5-formyltetrahydrofolate cyclo-ligase
MCPDYRLAVANDLSELALRLPELSVPTVALYSSIGFEPATGPLLAAFRAAGTRVLLPVVLPDLSLDWAVDGGPDAFRPGPRGIPEPTGPGLGPGAIAEADLVLLPGLLVDRAGNRLGRGGGCYDRALRLRRAGVPAVVLLYPPEVVEALPVDEHDVPVDAALTPEGLVALGVEWTNRPSVGEN